MTAGPYDPNAYGQPGGYPPPLPPIQGVHPGGLGIRFGARVIDGILVGFVAFFLAWTIDASSNILVTGLFSGLLTFIYFVAFEDARLDPGQEAPRLERSRPRRRTQADSQTIRDPQRIHTAADHSLRRLPRVHCLHRDRCDDQRKPNQAGQARRIGRGHTGRQVLTVLSPSARSCN